MRRIVVVLAALTLPFSLAAQDHEPIAASAPAEPALAPVEGEAPAESPEAPPDTLAAVPLEEPVASPAVTEGHAAEAAQEHGAGAEHAVGADHATGGEHAAGAEHAAGGEHADGEGHPPGVTVAQVANFVIFFGLLAFLLRKPLGSFLGERKKAIADSLAAGDEAERDAKARLAEMQARLARLETDVAAILQSARDQAGAERETIIARAKAEADRILAQAGAQVGEMEQASARRLRTVAAELAVDMAREIVAKQMLPEDRRRVFDRALKGLQKTS